MEFFANKLGPFPQAGASAKSGAQAPANNSQTRAPQPAASAPKAQQPAAQAPQRAAPPPPAPQPEKKKKGWF